VPFAVLAAHDFPQPDGDLVLVAGAADDAGDLGGVGGAARGSGKCFREKLTLYKSEGSGHTQPKARKRRSHQKATVPKKR
jgi:hypothetical protein